MGLNARLQERGKMDYVFKSWNQWDWGVEEGTAIGRKHEHK